MSTQKIEDMSFEQAMEALETIVQQLETGKIKLEDAVTAYERGVQLKKMCEEKLKAAQVKIEKLIIDQNGKPSGTEPYDIE